MARFLSGILFLLLAVSCSDIFSTRDPENPDGNNEGIYNETVADLLISLKTSLLTLDPYRYESLFLNLPDHEDSYRFISQASDIVSPELFDDWDIENEKYFIAGIKNDTIKFTKVELSYDSPNETAETVELNATYSITVAKPDTTFTLNGTFKFDLIKTNSLFWYIRTWTDISLSGNKSFSSLKEPYAY